MLAYDNRIEDKYENKIVITVMGSNEKEALSKAKAVSPRKFYEVTDAIEFYYDNRIEGYSSLVPITGSKTESQE